MVVTRRMAKQTRLSQPTTGFPIHRLLSELLPLIFDRLPGAYALAVRVHEYNLHLLTPQQFVRVVWWAMAVSVDKHIPDAYLYEHDTLMSEPSDRFPHVMPVGWTDHEVARRYTPLPTSITHLMGSDEARDGIEASLGGAINRIMDGYPNLVLHWLTAYTVYIRSLTLPDAFVLEHVMPFSVVAALVHGSAEVLDSPAFLQAALRSDARSYNDSRMDAYLGCLDWKALPVSTIVDAAVHAIKYPARQNRVLACFLYSQRDGIDKAVYDGLMRAWTPREGADSVELARDAMAFLCTIETMAGLVRAGKAPTCLTPITIVPECVREWLRRTHPTVVLADYVDKEPPLCHPLI